MKVYGLVLCPEIGNLWQTSDVQNVVVASRLYMVSFQVGKICFLFWISKVFLIIHQNISSPVLNLTISCYLFNMWRY